MGFINFGATSTLRITKTVEFYVNLSFIGAANIWCHSNFGFINFGATSTLRITKTVEFYVNLSFIGKGTMCLTKSCIVKDVTNWMPNTFSESPFSIVNVVRFLASLLVKFPC